MEYHVFLQKIKEEVAALCAKGDEITLEKILKNNTLEMDALVIRRKGETVSPTIYMEPFYSEYLSGASMEELAAKILETGNRNILPFSIRPDCFYDFQDLKSRVMFKLINTDRNQKLLSKIPSRPFFDLSVVYYLNLHEIDGGYASTMICFSHLEMWKITEEQLYEAAMENTAVLQPPVFMDAQTLAETLFGAVDLGLEGDSFMYVVTNSVSLYGAACILYRGFVKDFAKKYGSFFILPSSVHELIFVPDTGTVCPADLLNIVEAVNETAVSKEDFLSENIYRYDAVKQCLSVIYNIKKLGNIPN